MMIEEIIYGILLVTGIAFIGGAIYGFVMVQTDKYHSKKESKEREKFLKEGWKRYGEYMNRAKKARESKI